MAIPCPPESLAVRIAPPAVVLKFPGETPPYVQPDSPGIALDYKPRFDRKSSKMNAPLFRRPQALLALGFMTLLPLRLSAETAPPPGDPSRWTEAFDQPDAFAKQWTPYGFLAVGIDAQHPLGTNVSGLKSRPDWWQLEDGALCSRNFPEEKHAAGITHAATGTDIRMRCRVKLSKGGMAQITLRGNNPIVERNFHVAVLRLNTDSVTAAENDVLHPKDSPQAAAMKARGEWNRKFFFAKTEKRVVAPDVWHEITLELRGKELTTFVDGEKALTYTTLCGDVPKTSVGLAGGHSKKEEMRTWFDDVRWEPLEPASANP